MKILAIETSCDDTCAAVLDNDRVLSSVISSQTDLHAKWGGVVPDIAKRAHQSRIKAVISLALKRSNLTIFNFQFSKNNKERIEQIIEKGMKDIDIIAVTQGPGLAIALSVGVNTAKELATKYSKKLVAVNHIEGHLLSNLVKNSKGLPERKIAFPSLGLTVSGGHTKIVLVKRNDQFPISNFPTRGLPEGRQFPKFEYEVVGETLDDAAGEALDKAAKQMGLGYPGGPVIERLALKGKSDWLTLPHPMSGHKGFDYSFSGLKTSFYYQIKDWPKDKINKSLSNLAASYQKVVIETLLLKYKKAIEFYKPKSLMACGGVMANTALRKELRKMARKMNLPIYMPVKKALNTDNAMMIGLVGYYKAKRKEFTDPEMLDRDPRAGL